MKETAIDVLVFLFDNYLTIETDNLSDEFALACELEEAGFSSVEINKAFRWLCNLTNLYQNQYSTPQQNPNSVRILTKAEYQKLNSQCQGLLLSLQRVGLLDTTTREIIIESAMALGVDCLSLSVFKRIIGLVLLNSPKQDEWPLWAQTLVFDDESVSH